MAFRVLGGLAAALLVAVALAAGGPGTPVPGSARITELEALADGDRILVGFRLDRAFDDAFLRRIESGLPTELVYQIALERGRRRWFDRRLDEATLRVVAMYNAVQRDFLINTRLDGDLIRSRVVRDAAELETEMTRFVEIPTFSVPTGSTRELLSVRVRAELGTRTLLFFVPDTRTTEWTRTRVVSASSGP